VTEKRSPKIRTVSWGTLEVEEVGRLKDAKLWPGGGRGWDWNETGTRHRPGVQPEDLQELLSKGAKTVVIGQGMLKQLQVPRETLAWLEERGVEVSFLQTKKAVDEYNQRAEIEPVGALIHSTC
jgi:hypothetical protein